MGEENTIGCDFGEEIMLWRYPADSFAATSTLLVKSGQQAVLTVNGIVYDVLEMGLYTPGADTMPGIFKKRKYKVAYTGMIEADIWFINLQASPPQNWQLTNNDNNKLNPAVFPTQYIEATGSTRFSIKDASALFNITQPSADSYSASKLFDLIGADFRNSLPGIIYKKLLRDNALAASLVAPFDALSGFCMHYFNENLTAQKGYTISAFNIDSINITSNAPIKKQAIPVSGPIKKTNLNFDWKGCLTLIIAALVMYGSFKYFFKATGTDTKPPAYTIVDQNKNTATTPAQATPLYLAEIKKLQGWTYNESKNEDSVIEYKDAWLYSDQYLAGVAQGKYTSDVFSLKRVLPVLRLRKNFVPAENPTFEVWVQSDVVKPFAYKRTRFIKLRFDNDTTTIPAYVGQYDDMIYTLEPYSTFVPRLKRSEKLTITFLDYKSYIEKPLEFTYQTKGLTWNY